ncbi:unnamed protein product [Blepharisma stoltei]|uniref:RRM domain-containing protein n=1 Tax=Blepharisma stoltei TaxID=1481888 RepID=A0AAU9JB96_9CILI|nr:unnamed protein product [Blepharisma stoltei]
MRSPRKRSYSRSSSRSYRRHRRSPSYDRHGHRHSRDRYDSYERHHRHRSPHGSRRGGISNPPPDHPEANPGNNIYINNLSIETKEDELREIFSKYGTIKDMRIIKDPFTQESRGFGFVTYEKVEDAGEAIKNLDKTELQGKVIRVEKARRSKPHEPTPGSYNGPLAASSKYRNSYHRRRRTPSPLARSRRDRSISNSQNR